jgi:hypothetical protein
MDFPWRGGKKIMSRLIFPRSTDSSAPMMAFVWGANSKLGCVAIA